MPGARSNVIAKDAGFLKDGYAYVEVMACPGGCTNGGGQIKVEDVDHNVRGKSGQKEWLGKVDEAYFSGSEPDSDVEMGGMDDPSADMKPHRDGEGMTVDNISHTYIRSVLAHWSSITGISLDKLAYTSYRMVESDVGKEKKAEKRDNRDGISTERVAQLAGKIGGGW